MLAWHKIVVCDPTDLQECRLLVKLCLGSCAPVAFPLVPSCSCSGSRCMSTRNHCKTIKKCGGQPFNCCNRRRLECKRRSWIYRWMEICGEISPWRAYCCTLHTGGEGLDMNRDNSCSDKPFKGGYRSVSYTHLTLPTIYSV